MTHMVNVREFVSIIYDLRLIFINYDFTVSIKNTFFCTTKFYSGYRSNVKKLVVKLMQYFYHRKILSKLRIYQHRKYTAHNHFL